jgi:hypothetical protein
MTEPWFSISGEEILQSLRAVAGGESPEVVYAKIKGNSTRASDADKLPLPGWFAEGQLVTYACACGSTLVLTPGEVLDCCRAKGITADD